MTTRQHEFIQDKLMLYTLFLFRFFEWETLKGGKKQPYYIYFKDDGKWEAKEEETSSCEDAKRKVGEVAMSIKKEDGSSQSGSGTKRLLTMAGLFDHWKPPKVSEY